MEKAKKEELAKVMGERLKELRKATTDLGQKDVAAELGITKQAVSNYESGRNIPDVLVLIDLANYYSCSVDYLLGREEKMSQSAVDYTERASVNALLDSLNTIAEDEGDYLVESLAENINALAISNGNPQRRDFIACIGELIDLLTEYIEASTACGKRLSRQITEKNLTAEDVAVELARFNGFDDISQVMDDIRRTGIKAILSFSVNAKKALRIRTGWRNAQKEVATVKKKEYEKRFVEFMNRED